MKNKNIEFENIKSEYIKDLALFNETEINDEKIRNDFYNLEIYSEEEMDEYLEKLDDEYHYNYAVAETIAMNGPIDNKEVISSLNSIFIKNGIACVGGNKCGYYYYSMLKKTNDLLLKIVGCIEKKGLKDKEVLDISYKSYKDYYQTILLYLDCIFEYSNFIVSKYKNKKDKDYMIPIVEGSEKDIENIKKMKKYAEDKLKKYPNQFLYNLKFKKCIIHKYHNFEDELKKPFIQELIQISRDSYIESKEMADSLIFFDNLRVRKKKKSETS